jgi:hypothetical protein
MMLKCATGVLSCLAVLIAGTNQARSEVILYHNLTATPAGADPISTFGPLADSFSTGGTAGNLLDVKALLGGSASHTGAGSTSVQLMSDVGGSPGAVLATIGTLSDASLTGNNTVFDFALGTPFALNANTRYWIELSSTNGSNATWNWSRDLTGVGVAGESFFINGVHPNSMGPYQMEVTASAGTPSGTPSAFATPQPGGIVLLLMGVASFGVFAQVEKRRARLALA